jgi:hypothetical protein
MHYPVQYYQKKSHGPHTFLQGLGIGRNTDQVTAVGHDTLMSINQCDI